MKPVFKIVIAFELTIHGIVEMKKKTEDVFFIALFAYQIFQLQF